VEDAGRWVCGKATTLVKKVTRNRQFRLDLQVLRWMR
jgi:hypothetical protein